MRIAFLGSRGIPARYSGFETFYEEVATRLARRGHDVTVYNRSHFIRDVRGVYRGVRLVSLPSIPTKHLDTITHTLLSTLHALGGRYDVVYYCIVGNSPLVWLPRLTRARTLLNVDGEDWAREKWGRFARWYQRRCERIAVRTAHVVIADARVVQRRYAEQYRAFSVFVPYGANVRRDERTDALARWRLKPDGYFLFVGRFVPENALEVLIRAFREARTDRQLVVVGDAPYMHAYRGEVQRLAAGDARIVFTGYQFGDAYAQLSCHARAYIQPSGVEGTRPALLDQLGFGNCVLVRDAQANLEVIGDAGVSYEGAGAPETLRRAIERLDRETPLIEQCRRRAQERIRTYYHWDWITDFYEDLFRRLCAGEKLIASYDEFLATRSPAASTAT